MYTFLILSVKYLELLTSFQAFFIYERVLFKRLTDSCLAWAFKLFSIPLLTLRTFLFSAFQTCVIENRSILRTFLAFLWSLVPNWSFSWTNLTRISLRIPYWLDIIAYRFLNFFSLALFCCCIVSFIWLAFIETFTQRNVPIFSLSTCLTTQIFLIPIRCRLFTSLYCLTKLSLWIKESLSSTIFNTVLLCFTPYSAFWTFDATLGLSTIKRQRWRTRLTIFLLSVPRWLTCWAYTICIRSFWSRRSYLFITISRYFIKYFSSFTVFHTLVFSSIIKQSLRAQTSLLTEAVFWVFWAIKAFQTSLIDIRCAQRATGQIIFNAWCKNLQSIFLFSNISINPITGLQVIFIHTLTKIDQTLGHLRRQLIGHFGAVRIEDIWNNVQVIFLSLYLKTHKSSSCAIFTFNDFILQ